MFRFGGGRCCDAVFQPEPSVGPGTVSWVCIVGAAPVAAAGFFQYNGLTLERFLWAWLKSEVIMAGKRVWKSENYYEEAMKREVKKH